MEPPRTQYARSGDVNIAYQVVGDGPTDLVYVIGWVSNIDLVWEEPSYARFLHRLASFSRLILFDKRGTGLSDRVRIDACRRWSSAWTMCARSWTPPAPKRAALFGVSEGGPLCALFAATFPERTQRLAIVGGYRQWPAHDGQPRRAHRRRMGPHARLDGEPLGRATPRARRCATARQASTAIRSSAIGGRATCVRSVSPAAIDRLTRMNRDIDVRAGARRDRGADADHARGRATGRSASTTGAFSRR